jgi:hypothetical protein
LRPVVVSNRLYYVGLDTARPIVKLTGQTSRLVVGILLPICKHVHMFPMWVGIYVFPEIRDLSRVRFAVPVRVRVHRVLDANASREKHDLTYSRT